MKNKSQNILPLVTVNILSYNRKDELRNTLQKVYEQSYRNIEVIVVDNASSDGSPQMVKKEFPGVILIKLDKNIGIAGWNEGFKVANGEFVLVLDDDSYPQNNLLETTFCDGKISNDIGIIAFNVHNPVNQRLIYAQHSENLINFIGCGALINIQVLHDIGGYNELLFLYENEIEFSMRVLNSNYKIILNKEGVIYHLESKINRKIINKADKRRIYFNLRNVLFVLFLHFNNKNVLIHSSRVILSGILYSILKLSFITGLRALVDFISLAIKYSNHRMILKPNIQKLYGNGAYAGGFFHTNIFSKYSMLRDFNG